MTHTSSDTSKSPDGAALRERLRAHRTLSEAPEAELDWLLEHGAFEPRDRLFCVGVPAMPRDDHGAAETKNR
jgi:hypothetical protein